MFGCHQSSLDCALRSLQYIRVFPAPAPDLPQPHRSSQRRCSSNVSSQVSQQSEYFLLEVSLNKSIRRPEEYKKKVAEYVKKYATEEALRDQCGGEQVHTDI